MANQITDSKSARSITWFSRILRWTLGIGFIVVGILHIENGGWPAIVFGAIFFITGFFKPGRCIGDVCDRQ